MEHDTEASFLANALAAVLGSVGAFSLIVLCIWASAAASRRHIDIEMAPRSGLRSEEFDCPPPYPNPNVYQGSTLEDSELHVGDVADPKADTESAPA